MPKSDCCGVDRGAPDMTPVDRRASTRPHPGELKTCPKCYRMMRFDERYLMVRDQLVSDPAWQCENPQCGWIEHVRCTE